MMLHLPRVQMARVAILGNLKQALRCLVFWINSMKKISQKFIKAIKNFPRNSFYLLGGPPSRYWGWMLTLFVVCLAGVVVFGIYFFVSTNKLISADIILPEEERSLTIDRSGLEAAVKAIEKREKEYAEVLISPLKSDPSL